MGAFLMKQHPLLEYASDMRNESEAFQEIVLKMNNEKPLTEAQLKKALRKAYSYGHYVGHCRGEHHVKSVYGMIKKEEAL
jgi:hypothetical protein